MGLIKIIVALILFKIFIPAKIKNLIVLPLIFIISGILGKIEYFFQKTNKISLLISRFLLKNFYILSLKYKSLDFSKLPSNAIIAVKEHVTLYDWIPFFIHTNAFFIVKSEMVDNISIINSILKNFNVINISKTEQNTERIFNEIQNKQNINLILFITGGFNKTEVKSGAFYLSKRTTRPLYSCSISGLPKRWYEPSTHLNLKIEGPHNFKTIQEFKTFFSSTFKTK